MTTPTQRPVSAPVRSRASVQQAAYDEMRRPQAAIVFRLLRDSGESGVSWRELWAAGESNEPHEVNQRWEVGPIVVWLRSRGVDIEALYDTSVGETRFYLRGVGV